MSRSKLLQLLDTPDEPWGQDAISYDVGTNLLGDKTVIIVFSFKDDKVDSYKTIERKDS